MHKMIKAKVGGSNPLCCLKLGILSKWSTRWDLRSDPLPKGIPCSIPHKRGKTESVHTANYKVTFTTKTNTENIGKRVIGKRVFKPRTKKKNVLF